MLTASAPPDFAWPTIGRTALLAVLLNSGVASVLWLLVPSMGEFWPIWVRSQCIGLAITALAMAIGRLPGVKRFGGVASVLLLLLPAAPLGYLVGMALSSGLLGHPVTMTWGESAATGAVLATVLATGLAGLVLWGRQRIGSAEAAREHAQRLAAEAELRLLRAQLEPHMLFNTLANLRELVAEDPRAAQTMLDHLITFLRHTLAATRQPRTTLEQEFAQLEAYLSLMGVRMGSRLQWQIDLPVDLRAATLPPMLLQPLVENAIKHGVEPQPGPGAIQVAAVREGDEVLVTVTDTGRGMAALSAVDPAPAGDADAAAQPGSASYGLAHVRDRLRAEYGARAALQLEPNLPRGVMARVRFPA